MASAPIPSVQDFAVPEGSDVIAFYERQKPHGFLSSLSDSPIEFEGMTFPTAEHAYQAGKTKDPAIKKWLLSAPKPRHVAQAAHTLTDEDDGLDPNWNKAKFARMKAIIRAKFEQNPELKRQLLETGDAVLVEAGPTSKGVNGQANIVWGVPADGHPGKNALGRLLMEVRGELGGTGSPLPGFCDEAKLPTSQ